MGCQPEKKENKTTPETVLPAETHHTVTGADYMYRPDIGKTPWEGDLYAAVSWNDKRGTNVLIVSGLPQYFWKDYKKELGNLLPEDTRETDQEVTEIFAKHYVWSEAEKKFNIYWEFNDLLFGCCDVWMEYLSNSLEITDINNDGNGEAVFFYASTSGDGKLTKTWDGYQIFHDMTGHFVSKGRVGEGWKNVQDKNDHWLELDQRLTTMKDTLFLHFNRNAWMKHKKLKESEQEKPVENETGHEGHGH
ncbi:MAG: hypothetical protein Fur0041_23320 [Bacteroidia bacterium]